MLLKAWLVGWTVAMCLATNVLAQSGPGATNSNAAVPSNSVPSNSSPSNSSPPTADPSNLDQSAVELSAAVMSARIDQLLDEKLRATGWVAAGICSDAEFIRRASLDLTGAPPTASEVLEFTKSTKDPDKRQKLVDRLLASPISAMHLATSWADWMLPEEEGPQQQLGRQGLQGWLRDRFAENLRYDRLVSDLLVSTGPPQSGPTAFFVALEGKPEKIAAKTSRVFLGLQLDCAECHNHPFDKWSQRDFWGFAAYFAQLSTNVGEGNMQQLAEVTDKGEGEVTLPGESETIAPSPLVETGFSSLASGTRRQQLSLWLTARENPFVARAAVNRVWAMLFGRGLIEPVDDMRNLEMASHPELLRELSEYFAASGYDLRGLLALLSKTQAYQRCGLHESGLPPGGSYAIMPAKPLTETQLTTSLAHVARQVAGEENAGMQAALMSQLGKLRGDGSEAKLGIVSALVTLHGEAFDTVSREETSRLLKALDAPFMDQRQQLRWLFLATLSREPSVAEQQAFSELLPAAETNKEASTEPNSAWRSDLLWALINSTEFAMTP